MAQYSGSIQAYILSNNNVICDICGRKRKRSECTMAYGTGDIAVVMSCTDGCADERHPLNSPPPLIFDGQPVKDARPDPSEVFVTTTVSLQRWGSFYPATAWGSFNGANNEFGYNPIWLWGFFDQGQQLTGNSQ